MRDLSRGPRRDPFDSAGRPPKTDNAMGISLSSMQINMHFANGYNTTGTEIWNPLPFMSIVHESKWKGNCHVVLKCVLLTWGICSKTEELVLVMQISSCK